MELTVREYADKDKKALLECLTQLQDFVGTSDPLHRIRTGKDFDEEAYMRKFIDELKTNRGMIYVAEQSGKVVGYITGVIYSPEHDNLERYPSTDGIVKEFFIHPDQRGQGVGAMLIGQMEEYFWSHGCSVVKLDCFAFNEKAHSFYKKMGYEDRTISLVKSRTDRLTFSKFKAEDFPEYKLWYKDALLNRELGPMDNEWLEHVLKETDGCEYSVFRDDELIAVVGIKYPVEQYPDYYLTDFAMKPDLRYQGIGSEVLQELMKLHPLKPGQSWKAVVNQRNEKAAAFFKKHGWSVAEKPDKHGMLAMHYKTQPQAIN